MKEKLPVSWFFCWGVICSLGCDRLRPPAESEPTRPFELELLATESCPLPAHLDRKDVALLSYRVRLSSHRDAGVPANYFYATLLTSDGERYLSSYYGCTPLLTAGPLREGEQAEGFLNFSLPPSKIPEKLVYSPILMPSADGQAVQEVLLQRAGDAQAEEDQAPFGSAPAGGPL
jgi:hypothetical protein